MKIRHLAAAAALLLALPVSGALAQQQDDPWSHIVNMDTAGNWGQTPQRPRPRVVEATGQQFPQALRVTASRMANPWEMSVTTSTGADVHTGDTVMVMLFARAERPAEGGSRLPLRFQINAAPYTGLIDASFALTTEWKAFCASTVARQDFLKDASSVQLHMGTADQVIDVGPIFIFNLGQNYDPARLPRCPGA